MGAWWPESSIGLPQAENLHAALVRVDVLNEFTGSKIGQMLLLHAEEIAAASAAQHCRVTPNMPPALIPTNLTS
jgi:predicted N-acetyltransferase YhbS